MNTTRPISLRRACIILLAALCICLQMGHSGLAARQAEETPAATAAPTPTQMPTATSTKTPAATPASTPVATPGPGDEGEQPLRNHLLLVNWEHPYQGKGIDLVRMDSVIEKGLIGMRNSHKINKTTGEAANRMFLAAREEDAGKFVVDNVYRSVTRQEEMWKKRLRRNGANYGEDPYTTPVKVLPGGMSEHATGLALDIFAKSYQKSNVGFADTKEGKWLAQNAHRFGFVLRYPADKEHVTGVIYEPWHFRYVGVAPAKEMYEKGLCLEEYTKARAQ